MAQKALGNSRSQSFIVPKTFLGIKKEYTFNKSPKIDILKRAQKQSFGPDMTKYSGSEESSLKKYWKNTRGQFSPLPKQTFVSYYEKLSSQVPGPGRYINGGQIKKVKKKPDYDNPETPNYFHTLASNANNSPAPWKYTPKYSLVNTRTKQIKISKPKVPAKLKKSLGPGEYFQSVGRAHNYVMKKQTSALIFSTKKPNYIAEIIQNAMEVPGVGRYSKSNLPYEKYLVLKKGRLSKIMPGKVVRITDEEIKDKEWVPGPGSYNIGLNGGQYD